MRAETFDRVRRIIARFRSLPLETVGEDSRLQEDLELDSLDALDLIFEIEEEFKVSVPDDKVGEFRTVRAVCDGIEALQNTAAPAC
ncbi:MAG TPA: acyl carrier protein [Vicinamibacteria bacterium]|nr:acyl carrier protein [Vicinamibacteria bacterium]